ERQKKQGKGAEKTALKTAKKAAKREAKERSKSGLPEEEDIELILNQLAAKDRDRKVVTEEICEQPTPRVHASFTCNPLKENEFFLFGGEYYNGERVFVYNHLFRLKENKGVLTWSQVTSPNTPKPRSSHQAVASRTHLYIFGGEFTSPSQMQFYHHKDMWRLDAANCQWEEITSKNGPSPRSGHRAILWKNSMFVFGGFYDTGHDVRYFNDAYLFEFGEMKWKKLGEDKKGDNVSWPSPRSACGIGEFEDMIFVYGGYTKHGRSFSSSDDSHGIVHTDMWSLDPRAVVWTKVRRGGIPPSPRCGFSTCVHKKRNLVVFGGVHDEYSKHDLTSTFFNDIFVFRMDQRRWFPDEKVEVVQEVTEEDTNSSRPMKRINSHLSVRGNELIIFGGKVDADKREVTLDDIWTLDMSKLTEFKMIQQLSAAASFWVEDEDEEDEEDDGAWDSEDMEGSDSEDGTEEESEDDEEVEMETDADEKLGEGHEAAAAAIASMSREARRKRGMELRAELSKFEEEEIPKVGEGLKEFFDRTRDRWGMQAWESRKSSGKQMRRDGFMLAVARFEVLEPLVTEFARLVKLEEEESIDAAEGSVSHGSGKTVSSTRPREHK
ncbi:hypothetical protein GUITHDRAFT_82055, partial [Guillardia theta CCMP2712]